MTAAIHLSHAFARSRFGGLFMSLSPRLRSRCQRILVVLAVVLPVPIFAGLGMSLPLPATIERIAAKLVPFGNAGVLDAQTARGPGSTGSIILAPGERYGTVSLGRSGGHSLMPITAVSGRGRASGRSVLAPAPKASGPVRTSLPEQSGVKPNPVPSSGGPSPSGPSPTQSGGTPPTGSPPPTGGTNPSPVDTATAAASSAVNTVTTAAGSAAAAATGAVNALPHP